MVNLLKYAPLSVILISIHLIDVTAENSPQEELRKHQLELEIIRDEIASFEERIAEVRDSERESLTLLEHLDRQSVLIRTHLRNLRQEEQRLVREINRLREAIKDMEERLEQLKSHYAGYVSSVYRRGMIRDIELLFSSVSLNQFIIRAEYLRRFSQQRRSDLEEIVKTRARLEEDREKLDYALHGHREVIREKETEERRLGERTGERRNLLDTIRRDRVIYERELERKRRAEEELRGLIAELMERERIRLEGKSEVIPPSVPFASRKGELPWPVGEGEIAARFGEQVHPILKTVTQNTGIDISVPPDSPVYAVAEGDVVTIWWLPSYGNLIIIHHYDGYRTVYANLSEILVSEGDRVLPGDTIARSGESVSGAVLHFEIWKEREKQDPEAWLSSNR